MTKLIATRVALLVALVASSNVAVAGKGGSAGKLRQAIESGSVDAIVAEIERAEALACEACVTLVGALLADSRYAVREAAGWWFAKRPALARPLAEQFIVDLASPDAIRVRNAADFLGATVTYTALPAMRAAIRRPLGVEGKLAIVRAVATLAHPGGNEVLVNAMTDGDAGVRAAAAAAWREIRDQRGAAPVVALLGDADVRVRAQAATVVGAMRDATGRSALEALVVGDADPQVRKNAAWSLGRIGDAASRPALERAANDPSGFVRMTARSALKTLR